MNQKPAAERSLGMRPSDVCGRLLSALDASEGRRRQRKRDTTPDACGLDIKRRLLAQAVADDPPAEVFESWLMAQCIAQHEAGSLNSIPQGALRAMAKDVLAEWHMAQELPGFRRWLEDDAPSQDR